VAAGVRAAWCDILFKLSPEVNGETVSSRQQAVGSKEQAMNGIELLSLTANCPLLTANCFKKGTRVEIRD
jgi:hypothetical protein